MIVFPSVSVLIVNYNSGKYAINCIKSLMKQLKVRLQIIVVDNASLDDSLLLLNEYQDLITLIPNNQNVGFGQANNLAARYATGDYLLILNPDTEMEDSLCIFNLVNALHSKDCIGLVAPLINEPSKAKIVRPKYRYPSESRLRSKHAFYGLPGKIAWVLGACMLMKTSVYKKIEGFDPDYFLYGEDIDICLRIRKHGLEIYYDDHIQVNHISGASEIGAKNLDKWLRKRRGLFLFYKKHYEINDLVRICNQEILKCTIYKLIYSFTFLIGSKNYRSRIIDKTDRCNATITVAKETIESVH